MEGSHDDGTNKRKRDLEDQGDREQKKVHVEGGKVGIEQLHLPVGDAYLLCRTRKAPFSTRFALLCPGNAFGLSRPVSCTVYGDIGVFG